MTAIIIDIYTDGACSGNPGPGAWAAIIQIGNEEKELSGFERNTTNNRMELLAAIKALEYLHEKSNINLTSDSKYLLTGITEWMINWKKNNWRTSNKKPVKNLDLWKRLDHLNSTHNVNWFWIEGHSGHPQNERCDKLARETIRINSEQQLK